MAKFYGKVGYAIPAETTKGVWTDSITERQYYGDLVRDTTAKWTAGEDINDNVTINNAISIMADPFAYQHFSQIKYVEFEGVLWKVNSVEVKRPRLILNLGGVYNGE